VFTTAIYAGALPAQQVELPAVPAAVTEIETGARVPMDWTDAEAVSLAGHVEEGDAAPGARVGLQYVPRTVADPSEGDWRWPDGVGGPAYSLADGAPPDRESAEVPFEPAARTRVLTRLVMFGGAA
jgi:hypothetical protein